MAPELLLALLDELRETERLIVVGPTTLRDWIRRQHPSRTSERYTWEPSGDLPSPVLLSGQPDARSGAAALSALRGAVDLLEDGQGDALLTLPLSKEAVHEAGKGEFTGHTEYLEGRFGERGLMSFFGDTFNVGLVTRHCALRSVPDRLTPERVVHSVRVAHRFFLHHRERPPRFVLLGVNPHAGEGGRIGNEEAEVLGPALEELRDEGITVDGPLSADGYLPVRGKDVDMVFATYHDQGLAPFKLRHFFTGVHATLGLPVLRVSPDHGVASELAGTGRVDTRSTRNALRWLRDVMVSG